MARGDGKVFRPAPRGVPSPYLHIRYYRDGKMRQECSNTNNEDKARKLLRKRLGEKEEGKAFVPGSRRTTFEEMAAMLKADYEANERRSLDRALRSVEHLREHFGNERATRITPEVSRSRRWTMPERSGSPGHRVRGYRCSRACTSVPLRLPAAGCTTMPGALSIATTCSSS